MIICYIILADNSSGTTPASGAEVSLQTPFDRGIASVLSILRTGFALKQQSNASETDSMFRSHILASLPGVLNDPSLSHLRGYAKALLRSLCSNHAQYVIMKDSIQMDFIVELLSSTTSAKSVAPAALILGVKALRGISRRPAQLELLIARVPSYATALWQLMATSPPDKVVVVGVVDIVVAGFAISCAKVLLGVRDILIPITVLIGALYY